MSNPELDYRVVVNDSGDVSYVNRILVGTAVTGVVRIEWVQARYGQVIPTNWSQVTMLQYMSGYYPLRYQVAEAQNLIVKAAIENNFQWLLLWEHDVLAPPDSMIRMNTYMQEAKTPIVSGLYYTRSRPSEPILYRGLGTGAYLDWNLGDRVWVDGVPTGFLLVHVGVLREMWNDSEEYQVGKEVTRRVFHTPRGVWYDPESGQYNSTTGTSDLDWCRRIIAGDYLRKAGWNDFVDGLEDPRYPFLVDTQIFCRHIELNGEQFP